MAAGGLVGYGFCMVVVALTDVSFVCFLGKAWSAL